MSFHLNLHLHISYIIVITQIALFTGRNDIHNRGEEMWGNQIPHGCSPWRHQQNIAAITSACIFWTERDERLLYCADGHNTACLLPPLTHYTGWRESDNHLDID